LLWQSEVSVWPRNKFSLKKVPKIVGNTWFNSKPLKPDDLAGKIVLVDFWTYSCVNCIRTIPYLKKWWEHYRDKKFLIIGIHTPEFHFEKHPENVARAIKGLGITWPVVLDNDYINWNNFANRYWPAKYVIDKNGQIAFAHFGEGYYAGTEEIIQNLIKDNLGEVKLSRIEPDTQTAGGFCFIPTPELYCGYERGEINNYGGYYFDEVHDYQPPSELRPDSIALKGKFLAKPEYVESVQKGSTLFLRFRATEVNLVLDSKDKNATVQLLFNDKPLSNDIRGKNLNNSSELTIEKPNMYNLLKSGGMAEGMLSVAVKEGNFKAFAFTFSGCG
jgi:thiol-disulfide isomerase/thioredoxin